MYFLVDNIDTTVSNVIYIPAQTCVPTKLPFSPPRIPLQAARP